MTQTEHPELNEFTIFCLSKDKSPAEVTLRSADWAVITQIDGQKSVAAIAEILALSVEEAVAQFASLQDKGLITFLSVDKSPEILVPESFFVTLETELTKLIGPVAPLVIEDVFWSMEVDKEVLQVNRTAELIEAISDEISDEKKKLIFQQKMLLLIKEMNNS